jgi:hypothetical protein
LCARRHDRGDEALAIVRLEAVREKDDLLGEVLDRAFVNHEIVGNYIIDKWHTYTAGITKIADLDWRRAPSESKKTTVLRVASQIDKDVDSRFADLAAQSVVWQVRNVDELVESSRQAFACGAPIVPRSREPVDLAERAVVRLDETRHEISNSVRPEVGRQIAETQPPTPCWNT